MYLAISAALKNKLQISNALLKSFTFKVLSLSHRIWKHATEKVSRISI